MPVSPPSKHTVSSLCIHICLPVGRECFYSGTSCEFIYVPLNYLNLVEPERFQELCTFQWLCFHCGYNQSTFQRDTWEIPHSLHSRPPRSLIKMKHCSPSSCQMRLASSACSLSKPVLVWTRLYIN